MAKNNKCKFKWHTLFRCLLATFFYLLGTAAFIKYLLK